MKVGVENYWRFNGIKIPWTIVRMKMLASFESHEIDLVIFVKLLDPSFWVFLCQTNKVKYSTVKYKHFLAVLVSLGKLV